MSSVHPSRSRTRKHLLGCGIVGAMLTALLHRLPDTTPGIVHLHPMRAVHRDPCRLRPVSELAIPRRHGRRVKNKLAIRSRAHGLTTISESISTTTQGHVQCSTVNVRDVLDLYGAHALTGKFCAKWLRAQTGGILEGPVRQRRRCGISERRA